LSAQVGDILAIHAASKPDKVAVIEEGFMLTFAEVDDRANRFATALTALGIGEGDRVAGIGYNSYETTETTFAGQRLKVVGVPVNWHLKPPEIAYILNDCGAKAVIAGPEFVDAVEAARPSLSGELHFISLRGEAPPGWLSYPQLLARHEGGGLRQDDARLGATMIYTSGTTGRPKGAFRPNGVSIENVLQTIAIFGLNENDVHLVAGPGYHSAVAYFRTLHHLVGATVVVERKFDALEALQYIERYRVTTTFMAPTLIARMLNLPEEVRAGIDHSSLRAIIAGAAPFPAALKERCEAYFGQVLWEFYGATETGINTVLRPEDQLRKPGSCGEAVPGQEIRLLDGNGEEVPDGTPGEFWVRNSALAEYYNRPDATANSMREGFFSVGDIAYRDADGYYYICDRKIDMIISGGVNIYPAEIEAALVAHPAVEDVAVIGVPNEEFGEEVKAVVKLKPGERAGADELIAFAGERLAGYKRPRSVDFVDELPRDLAGKLQKRVLRDRYWAAAGRRI
jgi:fatty-acyl-CoA synthase/long-chain acyl-CoA synthetase